MKKILYIVVTIFIISYFFREQPKDLKQEVSIINDPGMSGTITWYSDPTTGEIVNVPTSKVGSYYQPGINNIKKSWQYYLTLPKFLAYMIFNLFFCFVFAGGKTQRLFGSLYYPLGSVFALWIFDLILRSGMFLGNKLIDHQNNSDYE